MIISFTLPTKEIFEPIQHFRKLTKRAVRKLTALEINCVFNTVTLSVPGASVKRICKTEGIGAYTVSLEYFFLLLKDHKKESIEVTLNDGELKVGNATVSGVMLGTKVLHPENLKVIDMPINYTDKDLLNLPLKYTDAVIDFAQAGWMIKEAQERLDKEIDKAHALLKSYGVERNDLQKIVDYRLGLYKDLPV